MPTPTSTESPLTVMTRVQAWPGMWALSRVVANADRMLTESARSNAAAALRAEDERRASWLAEADDWDLASRS